MQSCKLLPSDDQWLEKEVLYRFNLVIWEFHSVELGLKRPGNQATTFCEFGGELFVLTKKFLQIFVYMIFMTEKRWKVSF